MRDRFLERCILENSKSILLLGPRQVGKSTLIKNLKPDIEVNLARESDYIRFQADPERLEQLLEGQEYKNVFVDEIQRLPSLLNTIQVLIDESKGKVRYFLTGSSARKLKRGQANLLPGRVLVMRLGGLCGEEIPKSTKDSDLLRYGTLPEVVLSKSDNVKARLLSSYAGTYLREEIQAEAAVQNLAGFSRVLNEIAGSSGHVLDLSKVAQRAKVSRTSCVRFVEILEDTLIAERCQVYQRVRSTDPIRHPKLFLFDIGVRNALIESFDDSPERRGVLFEHFIFNQILNLKFGLDRDWKIEYFRNRSGLEVDFVISSGKRVVAIEVKSRPIERYDLKALNAFKSISEIEPTCFAVGFKERQLRKINGVQVCDWRSLLTQLENLLP